MPKKNVTTQVYEIQSAAGRLRVGPSATGMVVEIMQEGIAGAITLDFVAWQALCDLRDIVKLKRPRRVKGNG